MFASIKGKLLFWFTLIFSSLFLLLGLSLHHELEEAVIGSVDDHLHSEIQLIASLLDSEEGFHDVELSEVETGEYAVPLSGHYYQLISDKGEIIARSPSLSIVDAKLPSPGTGSGYTTIVGPGKEPLRSLVQTFPLSKGDITIQAAETLEESLSLLETFRNSLLVLFPLFFLIAGGGIYQITRSGLKSINAFSGKVSQITEKQLTERLDNEGIKSELLPLAESFNNMLSRLEDAFNKQGQFLSDASHDLRTPASVIKSNCDVVLSRERSAEEYREALMAIQAAAGDMSGLIGRIMEVSRLENDAFMLKLSMFDLKDLIETVVILFRPNAEQSGVKISFHGEPLQIEGDREKLSELFSNLIDNAVKYNSKGGAIEVRLTSSGHEVKVTIKDCGIGIAEEEIDKIFDRFYRVDKSRSVVEGSGLGLPIAKAIVEKHGGRIDLESSPGKGTLITIWLPINQ